MEVVSVAENVLFCCFKQSAGTGNQIQIPLRASYEYLRNIKPYGLFINAEIFLKAY